MGSKTTSTTVNQPPQFVKQPDNPYYKLAEAGLNNIDYHSGIIEGYARQDNEIKESGNDLFGANTSPEVASKVRDSRLFRSTVDRGHDLSNANQQENQAKTAGFMSLGGATAPISFNPGGTNTQLCLNGNQYY